MGALSKFLGAHIIMVVVVVVVMVVVVFVVVGRRRMVVLATDLVRDRDETRRVEGNEELRKTSWGKNRG
ncbi:hypothetical protein RchiOBHm_Chr5g0000331 [Rosa chinensis]|uniref:Uncharacterized protein n=1 Tax=Rosa chinensis TaxID=74649 RepID=A0A2P6Q1X1_ROSCH|nr:hypothetical protein RchiOBHm_Chr5g0000331 [Rosa chinensis]